MTAVTRGVVIASSLLAIATGLFSLSTVPALAGFLFAAFAAGVAAARWNAERAAMGVLLFAFISPGLTHLAAGPEYGIYAFAMLTAFVGARIGATTWTRWEAPGAWRTAVAWWATGVALTWPVFALRDLGDPFTRSGAALPIVVDALVQMTAALWLDHLLGNRPRHDAAIPVRAPAARYFPAFIASAVLTAIAAAYQRVVDPLWLNAEPWITFGRVPGLSGDSNPMAVAAGVWAPIAVAFAPATPAGKAAGAAATLVLAAGAWMSGARTTLLLLTIGAVGLALCFASSRRATPRATVAAAIGVGLVMVGLFVVAPRAPGSPVARLAGGWTTITTPSLREYAYELLWRRDGYGLAAVEAFKDHPWLGVGVGRFQGQSQYYYRRLTGEEFAGDNAQNLWRQTLAEQGVVGFAPVLWITLLTLRALVSRPRAPEDFVARAALVALGAALTVGYPVQDPGVALMLATLVAAVAFVPKRMMVSAPARAGSQPG
jgi:O-antigen ligase